MSDFSKWAESKVYTEDDGYASAELAWNHQQKEIDRLHRHIDDFQAEARKAREDADRLKQLIDDHNRYTDTNTAADTCDCGLYLLCPDCPNGHFIDDEQGERLED